MYIFFFYIILCHLEGIISPLWVCFSIMSWRETTSSLDTVIQKGGSWSTSSCVMKYSLAMGLLFTVMEAERWYNTNRWMNFPPESFILYIYIISVNRLQGAQGIAWIGTDSQAVGYQHCPHGPYNCFLSAQCISVAVARMKASKDWGEFKTSWGHFSNFWVLYTHIFRLTVFSWTHWKDIIGKIRVQYYIRRISHSVP